MWRMPPVHLGRPGLALIGIALSVGQVQALETELVASGLSQPVYVTAPPGDTDRLFIVELNTGQIKILDLVMLTINPDPFITITGLDDGEGGLHGLAFHPDFENNGQFYVDYVAEGGTSGLLTIAEYTVQAGDPDLADPSSERLILTIDEPQRNHNGGCTQNKRDVSDIRAQGIPQGNSTLSMQRRQARYQHLRKRSGKAYQSNTDN